MKKIILSLSVLVATSFAANAQFGKVKITGNTVNTVTKGVKALTLSDAEVAGYGQEYIDWMDKNNPLVSTTSKDKKNKDYAVRLANLKKQVPIKQVDGIKIDINAYYVIDVDAFACPNGSIRLTAGIMDIMTDDQLLAVIGHELGHIVNKDSKERYKKALTTSVLKDIASSAGGAVGTLTNSQFGALGEALAKSQYNQKQEYAADKYGFEFMKTIKKDSKSMATALGVLKKMQDDKGSAKSDQLSKWLSTHPELGKRITTLDKMK